MIDSTLERIDGRIERVENEYPIFYVSDLKDLIKRTEQTVLHNADDSGVKMTQYESWKDFNTMEGEYRSLEIRTASAHGVNLARHLGLPENEVFEEGLRVVELKRSLGEHFDHFTESRSRMPIYVPSEVKNFIDLRLGDRDKRESEKAYPATAIYGRGESMPVFVNDFNDLLEVVKDDSYREFHESKSDWRQHADYDEMIRIVEDTLEKEETSFFAVPHIYEERNKGSYFPALEDMTLVNDVDNIFAEEYDNSDLGTTGNAPAKFKMH